MLRVQLLLTVLLLAVVPAGAARSDIAGQVGGGLDIEFAFDGTGSMGPTIAQAQKDAERIMEAVRTLDPGVRFAVVAFRDPGYPAPEYEVLQRFSADVNVVRAGLGRLRSVNTSDPGNVSSEAYNLVFQRSVSDGSLGWRAGSRKVVVVFGDGEPHGAGAVGIRGCRDTAPDPHGLKTTDVLRRMREAGRTLVMVRQQGPTGVALDCYSGLAALAGGGGAARDGGSADLVTPVVSLIEGAFTPLVVDAGPAFALPGRPLTVKLNVLNKTGAAATLKSLTLRLPSGTSFLSATGPAGSATVRGGLVSWAQPRTLAPGSRVAVAVRLATGSGQGRLSFLGNAASTLIDNRQIVVAANARVRIGRVLGFRLLATERRSPVKGGVSLTYPASARTLLQRTRADGTVTLGRSLAGAYAVSVNSARVLAAGANASVVLSGTVRRSTLATCRAGTAVSLRLLDRDFRTPRTTPDLLEITGKGCNGRYPAEVRAG